MICFLTSISRFLFYYMAILEGEQRFSNCFKIYIKIILTFLVFYTMLIINVYTGSINV